MALLLVHHGLIDALSAETAKTDDLLPRFGIRETGKRIFSQTPGQASRYRQSVRPVTGARYQGGKASLCWQAFGKR